MARSFDSPGLLFVFCLAAVLGTLWIQSTDANVFTSMVDLEKLIETESSMLQLLNKYIDAEEVRLNLIKKVAKERKGGENVEEALKVENVNNPIDAFRVVKRALQPTSVFKLMHQNVADEMLDTLDPGLLPKDGDLNGAAGALFRIQDTYDLSPQQLIAGQVPGALIRQNLTADDCFQLGYAAAQESDFYHAIPWLTETLRLLKLEEAEKGLGRALRTFNISLLYDYLAFSLYEKGNYEWAVYFGRVLQQYEPTYPSVDNLPIYETALKEFGSKWDGSEESLPIIENVRDLEDVYLDFEALCRGEDLGTPPRTTKNVYCFLKRDNPFLFLAPIKTELAHSSPDIFVMYDVLSERETQALKDLAEPNLRRAKVVKDETEVAEDHEKREARRKMYGSREADEEEEQEDDANMVASYRIAKNMWLEDEDHEVVARISRRVVDMTGLDISSAENLQIANYGLGGHYEPHFDMTVEDGSNSVHNEEQGNRIATVLFYMEAPDKGGATVFEELNVGVFPVKNSAVFWLNLLDNGAPDLMTRHGACPVLLGTKWVANKWLHEFGNEFRRPCPLKPQK